MSQSFPVAITGIAYRFPGDYSDDITFWDTLRNKHDLVSQVPDDRWSTEELQHDTRSEPGRSISFSAGVLSRIDEFDAGFFGISPREAAWLDPQQRLLLELTWEAFENAGTPPSILAGSDCSVYVGISSLDYGTRGLDDLASLTAHSMTGNTLSVAANRLSYVFDLHGPSLAVDTACSSSLVAVHHACNSLRNGEASTALVGGVSLLLHPYPFVGFTKASMLSADGRCKAFDEAGNGYVRSEGGAVLLLKPLEQAQADGDEIHAVIRASGVNADGARKTGITIPSRDGQAELLREVLGRSGLSATDVDFVEAHGTGTPIGDPIETAAIGEVYGQGRPDPLPIGSVKANVGHLEAASGMAGLVKTVLALKNRALPPALHLQNPNPHIDFEGLNLSLVNEYTPLEKPNGEPLVAGVNSFGFGGANAHVLLQEHLAATPETSANQATEAAEPFPPLFLSARSEPALRAMAGRYAEHLESETEHGFYDVAFGAAFSRERLENRLALQTSTVKETVQLLHKFAGGEDPREVGLESRPTEAGDIAFVYSGNGAQWVGMGRSLLNESPRFTEIISEVDAAMRPITGFCLKAELNADEEHSRLDDTTVAQPLLFAIQVAITIMLKEQGVSPAAVTGHSVGEIAAAWASGALNLEQAIRVICARSRAQGLTRGMGRMAAVGMSKDALNEVLSQIETDIEIAGINSPGSLTLCGSLEGLQQLQSQLEPKGIFFLLLDLDYPFHSKMMEGVKVQLLEDLAGLTPTAADQATFVSTVTGNELDGSSLDATYWWRNVREPVQFADAVTKLVGLGCRTFTEVGPHAILQRYISEGLAEANSTARVIPTLRRQDDRLQRITEAALRVQLLSENPNLDAYFPHPGARVRLPNYPWQRERHWHPITSESTHTIDHRRVHPLLGWSLPGADRGWENTIDSATLPWLEDHKVAGAMVFPGAGYAEMALAAARECRGGEHFIVENLEIVSPMVLESGHSRTLRLSLNERDFGFQIKSRQRLSDDAWTLHAAGRLLEPTDWVPGAAIENPDERAKPVDDKTHYQLAHALGLEYGPVFQGLRGSRVGAHTLEATLVVNESIQSEDYLLHPGVLDVCFQSLIDFFADEIEAGSGLALLPVRVGRIDFCRAGSAASLRAHLRLRGARSVLADFEILGDAGDLIASVKGCRFRAAHILRDELHKISNWRIDRVLRPHPLEGMASPLMSVADIAAKARTTTPEIEEGRQRWFTEVLPLLEALTLSFAYEAFRQMAQESPGEWQSLLRTPFTRWLAGLLLDEGLLLEETDQVTVVADSGLPSAEDIWRTILRDEPACLGQLTLIGRIGRQLPALLRGEIDELALLDELSQSPVAEDLYHDDPGYLGSRLAIETTLRDLAHSWPGSRRLRVLEISVGLSELPKTLVDSLPEDRFDYVLALPNEALQTRQQSEYQDQASIQVETFSSSDWKIEHHEQLPDAYDVVILRHSLHRAANLKAALSEIRDRLAAGGLLLVAERHPDWSASFIEGIESAWWHAGPICEEGTTATIPGFLPPTFWLQALAENGFADCEAAFEPEAEDLGTGAYLVIAKRLAEPAKEAPKLPEPQAACWMLLADDTSTVSGKRLQASLESQGQQVVNAESLPPNQRTITRDIDHMVYMLGWNDTPEMASDTLAGLLSDVQQLTDPQGKPAQLWLITRGGAITTDLPDGGSPSPAQAALWGFGRVVMNEYPGLNCTLVDLTCDPLAGDTCARLRNELLQPDGGNEIILSATGRHVLVMQEAAEHPAKSSKQGARFLLDFHVPGQLRNLVWLPETERSLGDHEVEVQAKATGLNFRDVMYLMGLLPDEAVENGFAGASLGLEFAGVVSRTGAQVEDLAPGDSVMGFGSSCFASHIVTRADAVARMPKGWLFEAAATVPTVFLTVYYALKNLADLQQGERVLIHGAAGGVGIAAIQLARHLGAEIYATAGSDEKRIFVQLLGADRVFDSRSLAFADDILACTTSEGVDVVLNSLAGEAMRRSIDVLKPFGRFLELGKRDFYENSPLGLRPFRNNISYFGIDADQLLNGRPQLAARLFREVMILFQENALTPLPYRAFPNEKVVDAFRFMQQSRHIGKIVVTLAGAEPCIEEFEQEPESVTFENESTWLVTGGLSGYGLESARWLSSRGVGNLALVGRRGMQTPGAMAIVETFSRQGVNVSVHACDVSDAGSVSAVVNQIKEELPPLKGVLHAAAVFDDQLITNLDSESIESVVNTKLLGAWNLHQATLDSPLEYFVVYGSITTAIGNPAQANYVAANAGLEGLTAMRRHMGLPAMSIAWGPISDAGYLTRNVAIKDALEQRLGKAPLSTVEALAEFDRIFSKDTHLSIPANFDWDTLSRLLPSATSTRFDILNRNRNEQSEADDALDIRAMIAGKTPEEIADIVHSRIVHEVAQILCIKPERIEPNRSLHDLGMDSLMAVELALGLEQRFRIQLPVMMLNDAPTTEKVTARIVEKLVGESTDQEGPESNALISGLAQQHGEDMSAEEIQKIAEGVLELNQKEEV